jgi:hypothetical protein
MMTPLATADNQPGLLQGFLTDTPDPPQRHTPSFRFARPFRVQGLRLRLSLRTHQAAVVAA